MSNPSFVAAARSIANATHAQSAEASRSTGIASAETTRHRRIGGSAGMTGTQIRSSGTWTQLRLWAWTTFAFF